MPGCWAFDTDVPQSAEATTVRIAWVRWRDACFEAADAGGPVVPQLVELDEVGWFVGESDEVVTLCLELEPGLDGTPASHASRSRLHIPKVNIVEMRVVEDIRKAFPRRSVYIG